MGEPSETTSLTGKGLKDLERRRCVDVICLAFFVAAVAALGGLSEPNDSPTRGGRLSLERTVRVYADVVYTRVKMACERYA